MPCPFTRKEGQKMVTETQTPLQGKARVRTGIQHYQRQSEKNYRLRENTVQAQGKQRMLNILYVQINDTECMPELMSSKSNSSTE